MSSRPEKRSRAGNAALTYHTANYHHNPSNAHIRSIRRATRKYAGPRPIARLTDSLEVIAAYFSAHTLTSEGVLLIVSTTF